MNNEIKKFYLDIKNKKKIYQPSIFWQSASLKFYKQFKNKDLKNFKKNILFYDNLYTLEIYFY